MAMMSNLGLIGAVMPQKIIGYKIHAKKFMLIYHKKSHFASYVKVQINSPVQYSLFNIHLNI